MEPLTLTTIVAVIGITTSMMFAVGCIEPATQVTPQVTPQEIPQSTPQKIPTRTISGIEGEYNFVNGLKEKILISGIDNVVYVDRNDEVSISGIGNEIIRR